MRMYYSASYKLYVHAIAYYVDYSIDSGILDSPIHLLVDSSASSTSKYSSTPSFDSLIIAMLLEIIAMENYTYSRNFFHLSLHTQ